MRKIWISLLLFLGIGLAVALWWGFSERDKFPVVETLIVQPTTLYQELYTTGTVIPNARQELYSYSTGRIAKVHVREGDQVKAGQVLIELDTALVDAQIKQAEAGVEAAQASLQLAKDKLEAARTQSQSLDQGLSVETQLGQAGQSQAGQFDVTPNLNSQLNQRSSLGGLSQQFDPSALWEVWARENPGSVDLEALKEQVEMNIPANPRSIPTFEVMMPPPHISRSAQPTSATVSSTQQALIDQAQIGVQQAAAALKQAEAVLKAAQVQREQMILRATISGIVTELKAEAGNLASYQSPLAVVLDLSKLKIKAELNEVDGAQVKPGQEVFISGTILGNKIVKGTVEKVGIEAKTPNTFQTTGSKYVEVLIALDEEAEELKPGFTVDVRVMLAAKQDVLAVPYEALFQENNKTYVYTVSDGKLVKNEVTPGVADDTHQEIISGLQQGDRVVLSPLSSYYEGMEVKVAD